MLRKHICSVSKTCNIIIFILCLLLDFPTITYGITTTHYDKPPIHQSVQIKPKTEFQNLTQTERQKRLLPYVNFYVSQNLQQPQNDDYYNNDDRYQLINIGKINTQPPSVNKFRQLLRIPYQPNNNYEPQVTPRPPKTKFTPFLETNAIPGPFVPMVPEVQKIRVAYTPLSHRENIPNFSAIYDKLSQMRFQENRYEPRPFEPPKTRLHYVPRKQQINYIPLQEYQETHTPPKTFLHTYTPTNINIPTRQENYQQEIYEQPNQIVSQVQNKQIKSPIELSNLRSPILNTEILRLNPKEQYVPVITLSTQLPLQEHKQYHNQNHKQYLQEVIPSTKPILVVPQKQYQPILINNPNIYNKSRRPIALQSTPTYVPEPITAQFQHISTPMPTNPTTTNNIQEDNPNSLNQILKNLQDTNVLPHTLTPDNIDNSIKTLINILNSFKKDKKFSRPIVVADTEADLDDEIDENQDDPLSITETFPANTPEGGTPGKPGIDYPALSHIPPTNFDCQTQRYKGFFADPDTNCQVWHYCDLNGGQASFLCPNGTIFSQVALTCDWWFNVKCSTTTQLYVLNERLYKYIIPLKPKFPEDYTGPLVDKYLALKFKEMEEKLKREKKGKEGKDKDKNEEIDELQLLEDKNQESRSHTTENEEP